MMSRHRKPPSSRSSNSRLHHTGVGTTVEEEPTMIHSHRDDDDDDRTRPNVIARLMGMDDVDAVPTPAAAGDGIVQFQAHRRRRQINKLSLQLPHYYSYHDGDAEYSSSPSSRLCLNTMTMRVLPGSGWRRRRHPQEHEEVLQKMRQDLRAWQASKAPALLQTSSRPSSDSDGGSGSRSSLVLQAQAIAQEDMREQKMARYGFGFGFGLGGHAKVAQQDEPPLIKKKKKNESPSPTQGEGDPSSEQERDHAAAESAAAAPAAQVLPSHGHTPIVLLKPATTCSESSDTTVGVGRQKHKTSFLLGLPKLHRDANMTAVLQEVKNRVQRELRLTAATTTSTSGERFKAPASAWAIPQLQLQQVTKETKQDRGRRKMFRSESFRAFRSDRKRNAATTHASPEAYILMKSQTVSPAREESDASLSSALQPGVGGGVTDGHGQSFRSECLTLTKHKDDDAAPASPRLLFRSFSAPESGFAFSLGRLFSFKQQQASEPAPAEVDGFSSSLIRGTVSSPRHSFSSRRRNLPFRRRKTHWSNKASLAEIHPAKMEMPICTATSPSHETFSLFKVAQANLSELPPSPVSPLEVAAGHSSRHFFTDLHFTLPPELSPKCLSAPATTSESSFRTTDITAVETAWSRDKAYITELLIAAGLYDDVDDGLSSANARVDSMARPMPICDDVFEDMYYYRGDYIAGGGCMYDDHRMLFDLSNEALQSLVSSRGGGSSLRQWVVDSTGVARGKKLVHDVWRQVQALRNPQAQEMQTIEGMAAYEVRRSVWAEVLFEDVYVVGRKIERAIFDELIEDLFACFVVGFHMMKP